jgi:predicted CXXCH cytochrome family protein
MLVACSLAALALAAVVVTVRNPVGAIPPEGFERLRARAGYETSQSCAVCHRDHERSWRDTFHRTMTQGASEASVQGRFDAEPLDWLGVRSRALRDGDRFVIETPHPVTGEPTRYPILRTVGSRRMQQYLTRIGDRYVRLPVAFSMLEDRWFHLSEAFFHPDGDGFHANTSTWDVNCIFCHNVKARPGWDPTATPPRAVREHGLSVPGGTLASSVAELGIACEACHGPGEEHARRMRSPLRRYAYYALDVEDPTIVNPARLDPERSVQVCAHCHGQRVPEPQDSIRGILRRGDPFTPGEELGRYYAPVVHETVIGEFAFAPRFWSDGSPRLTAYEYQGLLRSRCYTEGELTCTSCHAMHEGDPRGQLRPDRPGDLMCTQCHAEYAGAALEGHTGHEPGGAGSRCVACHMPEVVYGVMTWHPTHEIASPDPADAARHDKPDACTLCHAGRSRAWAVSRTRETWPKATSALAAPNLDLELPEIPRALLGGDVVYRALAAHRLGEAPLEPEIQTLALALLGEALLDPYPNVRRTASRALTQLLVRRDLPLAHAPEAERGAWRNRLATIPIDLPEGVEPRWPVGVDGRPDSDLVARLIRERSEIPVPIGE